MILDTDRNEPRLATAQRCKPMEVCLLLVACALLSALAAYRASVVEFAVSSDQLTIPSLSWDLAHRGLHQLSTWQLSRAPYFFPDAVLYFATSILFENQFVALFFSSMLVFLLWIVFAGRMVSRLLGLPFAHCAAVVLAIEGLVLIILKGSPVEGLLVYRYTFANHFSAFVFAIAGYNLLSDAIESPIAGHIRSRGALSALVFIMTLSDQIYVIYYVIPGEMVILYACLRGLAPIRRCVALGFEQAVPAAVTVLAGRRIIELVVNLQPTPPLSVSSIPAGIVKMFDVIPWQGAAFLLAIGIPLIFSFAWGGALILLPKFAPWHVPNGTPGGSATRLRLASLFLLSSMLLALISGAALFDNFGATRYLMPVLSGPNIFVASFIASILPSVTRRYLLPVFVCAAASSYLYVAISLHRFQPLLMTPNEGLIREFASCVHNNDLTGGLANYWLARKLTMLLDWKLPINQLSPAYPALFDWGSNLSWFSQAVNSPNRIVRPRYNFIILDGFKKAEVSASFGPWDSVIECGGYEIAKYDSPDRLWNKVDLNLTRLVGQRNAQPLNVGERVSIPMGDFYSLVGSYSDGSWEAGGNAGPSAGFLIFGPYWPVNPGNYRITVSMTASGSVDDSWVDVIANAGKLVIANARLTSAVTSSHQSLTTILAGKLETSCPDLEIRVFYAGKGMLRVTGIVVERESD